MDDGQIKLKVLNNNILIKKNTQNTFGNLLLPESSSDNFFKGIIVNLGTGKKEKGEIVNFHVKIGDEVLFPKYKGHEIKLNNNTYVVLSEDEIIAIINNN